MASLIYLLCVLYVFIQGSCGEIVMTQSPEYISVSPGDTATISCTSSSDISRYLHWYQQKPGQQPKPLIYSTSYRHTGVPDRFTGSGSGYSYKLTITKVTGDDIAHYYCQQGHALPYTFGQKTTVDLKRENVSPLLSLFPPSPEELATNKATVVCLADSYFPKGGKTSWKADSKVINSGTEENESKNADGTYSVSSLLHLSKDQFKGFSQITCEWTHSTLSSPVIKSFKTAECTA